jgi:uncharacterized protein (TIGR00251 family)
VKKLFYLGRLSRTVDATSPVRRTKQGTEVDLLVSPSSGRSEVQGIDVWRKRLVVKLRSPPEKGEANAELESLLTDFFEARTLVVKGHANRMKTVVVAASEEEVRRRLEGANAGP